MCSGHEGGNCKTSINNTAMAPVQPSDNGTAGKLVPVKLYNFLASVTGASTEPKEECFVKLSISQDIFYKASKGRRAMSNTRHWQWLYVIYQDPHSWLDYWMASVKAHPTQVFWSTMQHLANKEIQRGNQALPSCLENRIFTRLVWDNNDFGEETLTGKGTTRKTNGIAIQHQPQNQEGSGTSCNHEEKERKISGSARSEISSCKQINNHTIPYLS